MRTENGWVIDDDGNRASIARWGSEEHATEILKSLKDCYGCSDCSRCSDCSDCSRCSGCSRCYLCSDCSDMAPQKVVRNVPVIADIHKKVWEAVSQENALDMSTWHKDAEVKDGAYCGTTHCRAGWVIALAGKEGRDLELQTTEVFAAMQIYRASGYDISPVRFFDSNESALADMKKLAGVE